LYPRSLSQILRNGTLAKPYQLADVEALLAKLLP